MEEPVNNGTFFLIGPTALSFYEIPPHQPTSQDVSPLAPGPMAPPTLSLCIRAETPRLLFYVLCSTLFQLTHTTTKPPFPTEGGSDVWRTTVVEIDERGNERSGRKEMGWGANSLGCRVCVCLSLVC